MNPAVQQRLEQTILNSLMCARDRESQRALRCLNTRFNVFVNLNGFVFK